MSDDRATRSTGQMVLLLILLGPSLIVFMAMGFDLIGSQPLNPYRFAFDAGYRRETRERWQQRDGAMAREVGSLLGVLILIVVTLSCYYAIYSLIRYNALPGWMGRIFCALSGCHR